MTCQKVSSRQSGNIFFALFGAVALVGILGAGVMTFMKGPLATSVKITRINTAQTQMALGAQVAVMASANTASSGDCDADGFVEPLEWRDAGAGAHPTGGGLIPMSIGISKKDPWGTEYGYCSWDNGTYQDAGCGGAAELRLQGGTGSAATAYPVVAIVSAGQDKNFTTTCRDFATADVNSDGDLLDAGDLPLVSKSVETDDDIIFTYTYDEATGASGGLWSIKSGSPDTAVINKKIETSGVASLQGGVLLPDSSLITCDPTTAGVMARNVSGGIDICNGSGWDEISGGSGASEMFNNDNTLPCDGTTVGQVRYNTTTELPEFCNGAQWLPFTINIPGINLVLTPTQQNGMDVDGASNIDPGIGGVCDDGIWYCGTPIVFTLTNQGTLQSSVIAYSVSNTGNFYVSDQSCTVAGGNADGKLDPNESCTITVIPKAKGNYDFTGNLSISSDNTPFAIMQGSSTGFGCVPGREGGGGKYAYCGLSSAEGTYDLIVTPGACNNSNPATCTGSTDYLVMAALNKWGYFPWWDDWNGAQLTVDQMKFANDMPSSGVNPPAVAYCANLSYNGYDDWYLPADLEMTNYIYPNRSVIGGFRTGSSDRYWTSTYHTSTSNQVRRVDMANGNREDDNYYNSRYVRCARRDNVPLPAARQDKNPGNTNIKNEIAYAPAGTVTSNTVTITNINTPIDVSISGGTNMDIIKNGVSTGSSSISGVIWGDTIAFSMDGPMVLGTKVTATLTIGSATVDWWVGYADSSITALVFVSNSTYDGKNLGGLAGADSKCQSLATSAGYSGTWTAILSDSMTAAVDRLPWNWGSLVRQDGVVVANDWSDLWDGSIQNPINITELGTVKSTYVFTSTNSDGSRYTTSSNSYNCNNWTSSADNYGDSYSGTSYSTNGQWVATGTFDNGCYHGTDLSLYCMSADPGDDDKPSDPNVTGDFVYTVQPTASTATFSNAKTLTGLGSGVGATVTVTGTDGSPGFEVSTDGGSNWSTGTSGVTTVQNGDQIRLTMTSPASPSSAATSDGYKMTVKIGSGPDIIWRLYTGDSTGSVTKRIFVTSGTHNGNYGGVVGADSYCQSQASSAGLGGSTWKAVLSGILEQDAAINRVGYNWTTLTLMDGTTVVATAGNMWSGTLSNPILQTQSGGTKTGQFVHSNTTAQGFVQNTSASSYDSCQNWASPSASLYSHTPRVGLNSVNSSQWIAYGYTNYNSHCGTGQSLYCIEQ